MPRKSSSDELSDVQVIDDEDRQLAAQIEAERKAKRAAKWKEKHGKVAKKRPTRKRRAASSDEEESEEESEDDDKKNKNKKKRAAKKETRRKAHSSSDEDEQSDDDTAKRRGKKQSKRRPPSSSEEDVKSKKGKKAPKKSVSSDEEEESEEEVKPKKKMKKTQKKKSSSSEEKSDSEDEKVKAKPSKKKAQKKATSSEDEEDLVIAPKSNKSKAKPQKMSSEESEEEVMPKKKIRHVMQISDESGSEDIKQKQFSGESSDDSIVLPSRKSTQRNSTGKKDDKKKKKGMIMDDSSLAKETVDAEKAEKERRKRLEQKQKEFNGIVLEEGADLTEMLTGTSSQRKLKSVVLDPDASSTPPVPVAVHDSLVRILKPHQAHGIQFMYDCAIESIDRLDTEGSGGILAHCMGLGKTLQVITFLHTVMMHDKTAEKCQRVLVVVPKNVIINWFKEFQKWLLDNDEELDTIDVAELDSCKTIEDRRKALKDWHNSETASVMIIGYDLFRILTAEDDPKKKKSKANRRLAKAKEDFRHCLQNPGPDLVVCDEAHKLKNDDSALSKTMVKIRTKRRICLTGTPLQNNLMEYHCMVNFVKPGLLGTKGEFANRFVNIINRGRTRDASSLEVSFMKRRCHVLYEHLKKCVDRKDYRVLTEAIPPKQEYVINVRLTDRQCSLYEAFLNDVVGTAGLSKRLLPDYHMLSRIWTHPYQLILHEQRMERERILKEEEEEEADFIDDGDESESESEASYSSESEEEGSVVVSSDDDSGKKKKKKNSKKSSKKNEKKEKPSSNRRRILDDDDDDEEDTAMNILQNGIRQSKRLAGEDADIRDTDTPPEYTGWFSKLGLVSDEDRDDFSLSYKLVLLMEIIKKCEEIGDKLLVFSQSLESLALIRRMLEFMAGTGQWFSDGHEALNAEGETWSWLDGEDYMTIDGSVQSGKRDAVQTSFNDPDNYRARLMLISTRAGSLGTNMVSANRVVIFDACWNPSHDTQSLFRVYRFGQTKPVYIYRFIAQGTMEERIYKRQVTKESTSMRVVDEAQIQRHYLVNDLTELYQFTPADPEIEITYAPPKDRLLADVLHQNRNAVVDYIEHDTLFANQEEEKLTEEEMKDAWDDYEKDKTGVVRQVLPVAGMGYGGGILMNPSVQSMLQTRYEEGMRMDQMQHDVLFKELQKMRVKDVGTAVKIVLLRNLLEQILPYIPHEMRGGMSEFNTHFIRLVHETDRKNETPADLLRKSLESFRTVIRMVRPLPTCREPLARMSKSYPYLFTE
uniref:Transcriptional regulator ATRX n=1 Tax=Caenorhabditis japonica TaxID=281687 RepID=A0A8R1I1L5_CAEJA